MNAYTPLAIAADGETIMGLYSFRYDLFAPSPNSYRTYHVLCFDADKGFDSEGVEAPAESERIGYIIGREAAEEAWGRLTGGEIEEAAFEGRWA